MKIAGIVAEYNPFHNGHAHHIQRTRAPDGGCAATHIVAVMGGHFLQRGEPALLPKAHRVRAALAGGVDLVLELPLPWAMATAESFALGAVAILDGLGCVDTLSFGSECGSTAPLEKVADALESARFAQLLRLRMDGGIPFPEARQKAVAEIAGLTAAAVLEAPNNILGVEYIKALRRLDSSMKPFTIPRFGAGHDDRVPLGDVASASYLRSLIRAERLLNAAPFMPPACCHILSGAMEDGLCPSDPALAGRAVLSRLRTMTKEEMGRLPGVSEGLENRLYSASRRAGSLDELEAAVKTRRYALSRIRRMIWAAYLGLESGWEQRTPPYLRVLGANERGLEILSAAQPRLPLLAKPSQADRLDGEARNVFEREALAADLYALTLPAPPPCGAEFTAGLIRV